MSIREGEKGEGTSVCFDVVLVLESLVFGEDNSSERRHVYWSDGECSGYFQEWHDGAQQKRSIHRQ